MIANRKRDFWDAHIATECSRYFHNVKKDLFVYASVIRQDFGVTFSFESGWSFAWKVCIMMEPEILITHVEIWYSESTSCENETFGCFV